VIVAEEPAELRTTCIMQNSPCQLDSAGVGSAAVGTNPAIRSNDPHTGLDEELLCPFPGRAIDGSGDRSLGGDIWFAFDETRPLACFAGVHQRHLWVPDEGVERGSRRHPPECR
jgi:hypothetical protein